MIPANKRGKNFVNNVRGSGGRGTAILIKDLRFRESQTIILSNFTIHRKF